MLDQLLTNYIQEPESDANNFALGRHYHSIGQLAAAVSYYVRTAERTPNPELQYTCLILCSEIFRQLGNRALSTKGMLLRAVSVLPQRPEAYYQLARHSHEQAVFHDGNEFSVENWFFGYSMASAGLCYAGEFLISLPADVDYPGASGLMYEQAVCAWHSGLCEQSREIFLELLNRTEDHSDLRKKAEQELKNQGVDLSQHNFKRVIQTPGLRWYEDQNYYRIAGFVDPGVITVLDQIQRNGLASTGGVCEIGVHHGQLYMMMNSVTSSDEKSYAVDIFDQQHLNIDRSGRGDLACFMENLRNLDIHSGSNTEIVVGDSTDSRLDLVNTIGRGTMRMVSVDGGHTAEHVYNDLCVAEQILHTEGVVLLDDIMHPGWIEVAQGAVRYFQEDRNLKPFAIGYNKLWLCRPTYYHRYFDTLLRSTISQHRTQEFCRHRVVSVST